MLKVTGDNVQRRHFMMSNHADPPFQLFRWILNTAEGIDITERFDPNKNAWIKHDNDYIRDNFLGYKFDLSNIDDVTSDDEAMELATVGWRARRFES